MSELMDAVLESAGVDLEKIEANTKDCNILNVTLTLTYSDMCIVEWAVGDMLNACRKDVTKLQNTSPRSIEQGLYLDILQTRIKKDKKILEAIQQAFFVALKNDVQSINQ